MRNVGDCLSTFVDLLVHHLHVLFSCLDQRGRGEGWGGNQENNEGEGGGRFPPSPPFCCARRVELIEDLLRLLLRFLKKGALCLTGPDQKCVLEEALSLSKGGGGGEGGREGGEGGWVGGIVDCCEALGEQLRDDFVEE